MFKLVNIDGNPIVANVTNMTFSSCEEKEEEVKKKKKREMLLILFSEAHKLFNEMLFCMTSLLSRDGWFF